MIQLQPVNEMLKELSKIDSDIQALTQRLDSKLTTEKKRVTNMKYLAQAMELKNELIDILQEEYCQLISLEQLMFDIQNKN